MTANFVLPDDLDPMTRHPKAAAPGERMMMHNPFCFGCGDQSPRGLKLKMYAGEDFSVTSRFTVEPWMEGGPGVIHGGLLASALDDVMGMVPLLMGPGAVTGHLQIDYRRPVPVGSEVIIDAVALGRQRRKIYSRGVAHLGDPAEPLATAHGLFIYIEAAEHFAENLAKSSLSEEHKQQLRERRSRP